MSKKKVLWVVGSVVVLAGAGGGVAALNRGPKPTPVQTATVGREDLQAKVTANGKVQAQKKVDISATIPGQVTHLAVEEGDRVKKGQFLLQIDAGQPAGRGAQQRGLDAGAAARPRLAPAPTASRRAPTPRAPRRTTGPASSRTPTLRAGAHRGWRPPRPPLPAAERRVEQARATLEGARDTLAKTTVRSPMDGIVTAKRVEEGEVAVIGVQNQPGTVLLTISDMSVVETEMEVDETSIPSVKVGPGGARPHRRLSQPDLRRRRDRGRQQPDPRQPARTTEAIKFKVKIQIKNPPDGHQAGPVGAGRHPHRLPRPGRWSCRSRRSWCATIERKPGEHAEARGAARRGGRLPRRERQGALPGDQDRPPRRAVGRGASKGLKGGETLITGPVQGPAQR